jgi:type IV pilus assembly protein PilA
MHRPLPRGPRGSTILEAAVVLVMLGLLSAIALPRFLSSRARAHQAEVRNNLNSWMHAQRSFYEENGRYEMDLQRLGFTVERGNRYAYFFGFVTTLCERRDTEVAVPPRPTPWGTTCIAVDRYEHGMNTPALPAGMLLTQGFGITHTGEGFAPGNPGVTNGPEGWTPEGNISAVAVGNIDQDLAGVDSWYISSADARVSLKCGESKEHLEAGTPINTYDDVDHDSFAGCF